MDIKERIEKLKNLKEEFEAKKARLLSVRRLEERMDPNNLSKLLESDLEQAELILAGKDIINKLQRMAEDLAKIGAQEVLPLVDNMRSVFGPAAADIFENAAQDSVNGAMTAIRAAKDNINNSLLQVSGQISGNPSSDMAMGNQMAQPAPASDMAGAGAPAAGAPGAEVPGDDFGGADAASGPEEEPLGRAKKVGESKEEGKKPEWLTAAEKKAEKKEKTDEGKTFRRGEDEEEGDIKKDRQDAKAKRKEAKSKRDISEAYEVYGRSLLETETLSSLVAWALKEAASTMPAEQFAPFAQKIANGAAQAPEKMAGFLGAKKYGHAAMAQMNAPTVTSAMGQTMAEADEDDGEDDVTAKELDEKHEGFAKLKGELSHEKKVHNPGALAAWIGRKKYGDRKFNKAAEAGHEVHEGKGWDDEDGSEDWKDGKRRNKGRDLERSQRRQEKTPESYSQYDLAQSIAETISENITQYGKGYAAHVVSGFSTGINLAEDDGVTVLEAFAELYGMSPAQFSSKAMREARLAEDMPLSPLDKQNTTQIMSKVATGMATDKNMANKPISSITGSMTPQERSTLTKVQNNAAGKAGGVRPVSIGDLMKGMTDDGSNSTSSTSNTSSISNTSSTNGTNPPNGTGQQIGERANGTESMNKGAPMQTDAGKHKANTNKPKQTAPMSYNNALKPTAKAKGVLAKGTVSESEDDNGPCEIHGVMGVQSKRFHKRFKSRSAAEAWMNKNEGNIEVHGHRTAESIDENINEPHWPVNTWGQYKGEPMQTDYGTHSAEMKVSTKEIKQDASGVPPEHRGGKKPTESKPATEKSAPKKEDNKPDFLKKSEEKTEESEETEE